MHVVKAFVPGVLCLLNKLSVEFQYPGCAYSVSMVVQA